MKTRLLTLLSIGCALVMVACAARRVSHDYLFDVIGVITDEHAEPLQDAEVTLEVNGQVYEAVTRVKTVKPMTNSTGGFVFMYISEEPDVKYTLTVRKEGFEPQTVSGSAHPTGNHVIRLKRAGGNG